MSKIKYNLHGNVALIEMDNPPLNTWGFEQRADMSAALDKAVQDDAVKAIVIMGTDRAFSGGADITEFTDPSKSGREPNLKVLISQLEHTPKPIIAAISGVALGGGLEFALGCHFRVAKPDATVGLPEVKLGILPGAGGTQRLPRVAGVEPALNMIVSGTPVPAMMLAGTKLFDEIIPGDLKEGALAFANKVISENRPIKLVRDMKIKMPNSEAFFMFARNTVGAMSKNYPAPLKCVDAVEASVTQPFDKGMQIEHDAFMYLMGTPESRSLRHVFFAERAASKIPDVPDDIPTRKIEKVGVIGAGTMGGGITMNFLSAGIPVTMVETQQEALDRGVATIRKNYEGSMKKGKLTPEKLEKAMSLLTPTLKLEDVKDSDLVIEAIFEKMDIKEDMFRKLDEIVKPGAILASNTSYLDINQIARATKRPADVLGMHFFSPANVMKLLEIVRGDKTAKDVLATIMKLSKTIKKTAVIAGVCPGFIGNRMIAKYFETAFDLIMKGALPHQIDKALEKFGMAMGVFRMSDMAGNDVGWQARKVELENDPTIKKTLRDRLCEMGRFGQKAGAGWYFYPPGTRDAVPDPIVDKMITDAMAEEGITPRKFSDQEIVERCIYALINEGARIVEEGFASRASDIDVVYLYGYGFPAFRGGPMNYANEVGLYNVARRMREFAAEPGADKKFWTPAPLIEKLIKEGKSFS